MRFLQALAELILKVGMHVSTRTVLFVESGKEGEMVAFEPSGLVIVGIEISVPPIAGVRITTLRYELTYLIDRKD